MEHVKIGINPLTWTNDDLPTLGGETTLEQCLIEGKSAGFAGFELGQKFPREATALKQTLEQRELELVSGWFSGMILNLTVDEEVARLQPHLKLLKELGAESIVYCDITDTIQGQASIGLSKRPRLQEHQWLEFADKLSALAKSVSAQGMKFAYHHHMGTIIQSADDIDRLMELTTNDVYLLLDTGHLWYAGGDAVAIAKRYGSRICHVHCKDIRADIAQQTLNRDRSFLQGVLDGVFTIPGDGCVRFVDVFKELKKHDYRGWLVIEAEQDPVVAPSFETAKKAFLQTQELAMDSNLLTASL